MTKTPSLVAQRAQIFQAAKPFIATHGFGNTALREAAKKLGMDPARAELLFPDAGLDLCRYFFDQVQAEWQKKLPQAIAKEQKIRAKIHAGLMSRLELLDPDLERQAVKFCAHPRRAGFATQCLYQIVDDVWHAAGDTSTDWNFYTKRGLLAGVYTSTLLFWLSDHSDDYADTAKFLSRRIEGVLSIGKITAEIKHYWSILPDAIKLARKMKRAA